MQDTITPDYFTQRAYLARQNGHATSKVSYTTRRSLQRQDEEWVTVECSVELECPQTADDMSGAAALAFKTALGYTNDGMSHMAPGSTPIPFEP